MSDEIISLATRALRDQTDGRSERARDTEARIVERVHRGPRMLGLPVRFGLAAVLVGSTVWAGAGERVLEFVRDAREQWASAEAADGMATDGAKPARQATAPIQHGETQQGVNSASDEPLVDETKPTARATEQSAEPNRAGQRLAASHTPALGGADERGGERTSATAFVGEAAEAAPQERRAGGGDADDEARVAPAAAAERSQISPVRAELDSYERAHRLQFTLGDFAGARAAWDAYLFAYPRGSLALEARFNRALCLIEVGQTARARRELESFASGAYGAYRRAESQRLLDRLD